ncbi:MAG: TonB-dependent receptor plug domain-containing protein [Nitrospiria bacterium]
MRPIIYLLIIICLVCPKQTLAEEPGEELADIFAIFSEEKMVITPSKHPQPISHSPSTITVITEDEIRRSGATSIPDILRSVPGMEVMQTSSAEFNVSIRGNNQLQANKLLVLIDGRSVQEEVQNFVLWTAFPIVLEEIDRIEVIRGPGSAIWGSNAFDGVVNIITKSPKELKGTFISAASGQIKTTLASLVHAGETGRFDYKLSLGYHRANEWRDRDELALEIFRGNVLLRYHLSPERRLSLSGGSSHAPRYDGPLFDIFVRPLDTDIQYNHLQFLYEGPRSLIRVYWNNFRSKLKQIPPPGPEFIAIARLYNLEWRHHVSIGPTHQFVGGINYRLNDVKGNVFDQRHFIHLVGVYLQDEWTPRGSLTLVIGGRYDYHTTIRHTFSPRGSLLYRPTARQTFRLSAGLAYRAPTPLELFERVDITLPLEPMIDEIVGNRELDPERIVSYEAGYSTLLFERLKGEITLFYNRLTDLINADPVVGPPTQFTQFNVGKTEVYGGELGGEMLLTPWLTAFANYAYQQVDGQTPDPIKRAAPRHKVNGGIRMEFGNGLKTNLLVHHVSKIAFPETKAITALGRSRETGSYTLVNLRAGYRIWDEKMEVAFSVFNLFNERHRDHPLGDQIGTRVLGTLNLKF